MDVPAIKGSAFQSVAADVSRLAQEGRIDLEEAGLSDKDRGYLDEHLTPVSWVPMASYDRLLQLLCQVEGEPDPARYLRKRGARAAERLLSSSYESFKVEQGSWSPRVARTFVGISRMLYNFSAWSVVEVADDTIEFRVDEAAQLPDTALEAAHGFLEFFAGLASGKRAEVEHERVGTERVSFRVRAS